MPDCTKCKYAEWTYETYYNTRKKQWFVDGCRKDLDEDDCDEFEEVEMTDEYIRKEDAIRVAAYYQIKRNGFPMSDYEYGRNQVADSVASDLEDMSPVDVVPYFIEPNGTLTITVPKGTKRIGRILIEEDGTQYGGLFYPDTGGCFLSSMEKE